MKELMSLCILKYGGDERLVDRLLNHSGTEYLAWVVHNVVDENHVYDSLQDLADMLSIPLTRVRYAYFSVSFYSHGELKCKPEYELVMETLQNLYDAPDLWRSLERYCFRQLKRICIEELISKDVNPKEICDVLEVSNGLVYNVRKDYIKRILIEKSKI